MEATFGSDAVSGRSDDTHRVVLVSPIIQACREQRGLAAIHAFDVAIPYREVSCNDIAATIVELIEQLAINQTIIELASGEVPVAEAGRRLARIERPHRHGGGQPT